MDNKTYLDQLDRIKKSIWLLDLKIERKEQALHSISSPGFEPHYSNGAPSGDVAHAKRIIELETLKSNRKTIMEIYQHFEQEVETILDNQNTECSEILADRYLKNMTLREIGYHFGYGKTTISRKMMQGIDSLVLPKQPFIAENAFKASGVQEFLVAA